MLIPQAVIQADPGTWTAWTPQLTASSSNPTLGSGSGQSGRYYRQGNFIYAWAMITFGSSGVAAGSGTYQFSLPVAASTNQTAFSFIGSMWVFDSDAATGRIALTRRDGTNDWVIAWVDSATGSISNTSPWTWAASDQIRYFLSYEAAS